MKTQSGRLTRRRKHFARHYDDNSEWRNIADSARNETDRLAFEALVDRANEWEA